MCVCVPLAPHNPKKLEISRVIFKLWLENSDSMSKGRVWRVRSDPLTKSCIDHAAAIWSNYWLPAAGRIIATRAAVGASNDDVDNKGNDDVDSEDNDDVDGEDVDEENVGHRVKRRSHRLSHRLNIPHHFLLKPHYYYFYYF